MDNMVKTYQVSERELMRISTELLLFHGIEQQDAIDIAKSLVFCDLRGVDTHGIMRLPTYLKRIELGLVSRENQVQIESETNTVTMIDAHNYLGPVAATRAMQCAMDKAEKNTVGISFVKNNQHYGACAYYSMMALERNMIGFTTTNTAPLMAPTGGKSRMIGNNPFSFAAPSGKHLPFVLDVAMSNVAGGKIILAQKNGQSIPLGWALDRDGNPTQDAYEGFAGGGMLLPIGGHKGYGMALMFDILSGVLSGSLFGSSVGNTTDFTRTDIMGTGHMMAAIKIEDIMPIGLFHQRMEQLFDEVKQAPRIDGVNELLIPGELEFRMQKKRIEGGVAITQGVYAELSELLSSAGLDAMRTVE